MWKNGQTPHIHPLNSVLRPRFPIFVSHDLFVHLFAFEALWASKKIHTEDANIDADISERNEKKKDKLAVSSSSPNSKQKIVEKVKLEKN